MKILLVIRGPIRIDTDKCMDNIKILRDSLKEHEVDSLWVGWSSENINDIVSRKFCNHYLFLKDPNSNISYYKEMAPVFNPERHSVQHANSIRMYFSMKAVCSYIESYKEYDYVVMTRAECTVVPGDINNWFIKNTYCFPSVNAFGAQCSKKGASMNDCFGVAQPDIFRDTWRTKQDDIGFLKHLFSISVGGECIPIIISESNNVQSMAVSTSHFSLPIMGNRH